MPGRPHFSRHGPRLTENRPVELGIDSRGPDKVIHTKVVPEIEREWRETGTVSTKTVLDPVSLQRPMERLPPLLGLL